MKKHYRHPLLPNWTSPKALWRPENLGEAIRSARHSLYEKKTARASSILTRAYCLQGDLGAAKAELGHVAVSDRARVIKACRSVGMDL